MSYCVAPSCHHRRRTHLGVIESSIHFLRENEDNPYIHCFQFLYTQYILCDKVNFVQMFKESVNNILRKYHKGVVNTSLPKDSYTCRSGRKGRQFFLHTP